jgi:hypothetical protein
VIGTHAYFFRLAYFFYLERKQSTSIAMNISTGRGYLEMKLKPVFVWNILLWLRTTQLFYEFRIIISNKCTSIYLLHIYKILVHVSALMGHLQGVVHYKTHLIITICGRSHLGLVKVKNVVKIKSMLRNWPLWLVLLLRVCAVSRRWLCLPDTAQTRIYVMYIYM